MSFRKTATALSDGKAGLALTDDFFVRPVIGDDVTSMIVWSKGSNSFFKQGWSRNETTTFGYVLDTPFLSSLAIAAMASSGHGTSFFLWLGGDWEKTTATCFFHSAASGCRIPIHRVPSISFGL